MLQDRRFLLWCLLGLFALVCGVWVWNVVFTSQSFFHAGTKPPAVVAQTSPPDLPPLRATDPVVGATSTQAVTIVEFSDFACVYCRMNEAEMRKILAEYPTKVRLVWRDFPVHTDTPDSTVTALAARCADDQGYFWEMHQAIFDSDTTSYAQLTTLAHRIVPDRARFDSCLQEAKPMAALQADVELAKQHHLTSVPTLFIDGKPYEGLLSDSDLHSIIRGALLWKH
jgi:protein-disulfide isomerase